jgi:hypothetical protein
MIKEWKRRIAVAGKNVIDSLRKKNVDKALLFELAGIAVICIGGFMWTPVLGMFMTGAALFTIGYQSEGRTK